MEIRNAILEGTIQVFNEKGLKFTMDDIASLLGMSKKTIYKVFRDKEELFFKM
jgi:AcrR family transcriptional regulator